MIISESLRLKSYSASCPRVPGQGGALPPEPRQARGLGPSGPGHRRESLRQRRDHQARRCSAYAALHLRCDSDFSYNAGFFHGCQYIQGRTQEQRIRPCLRQHRHRNGWEKENSDQHGRASRGRGSLRQFETTRQAVGPFSKTWSAVQSMGSLSRTSLLPSKTPGASIQCILNALVQENAFVLLQRMGTVRLVERKPAATLRGDAGQRPTGKIRYSTLESTFPVAVLVRDAGGGVHLRVDEEMTTPSLLLSFSPKRKSTKQTFKLIASTTKPKPKEWPEGKGKIITTPKTQTDKVSPMELVAIRAHTLRHAREASCPKPTRYRAQQLLHQTQSIATVHDFQSKSKLIHPDIRHGQLQTVCPSQLVGTSDRRPFFFLTALVNHRDCSSAHSQAIVQRLIKKKKTLLIPRGDWDPGRTPRNFRTIRFVYQQRYMQATLVVCNN
ncbi:unnamed protein product [Trichogramma brassicae]|uniref:Uncharacterized protein n=1 Tax=Trichogramma brassicae TaxID=86971 RepID=A0A6H5J268_9HYME|nr:unnamed protein product [Trichogramma brassicae]